MLSSSLSKLGPEQEDIKLLDSFLSSQHAFLDTSIQSFVKEQAEIERQYSKQYANLIKKYSLKRKQSSGLVFSTWDSLLTQLKEYANSRMEYSVALANTDKLKTIMSENDSIRRDQALFVDLLVKERDSLIKQAINHKQAYLDSCDVVQTSRIKFEKSADEKVREKLNKVCLND